VEGRKVDGREPGEGAKGDEGMDGMETEEKRGRGIH
jgi:hypothetical protein